jgi:hypothetical protein
MKRRGSRVDVVLSITLALLATLGPLTALGRWTAEHGSAGKWIYLSFALPQGAGLGGVGAPAGRAGVWLKPVLGTMGT